MIEIGALLSHHDYSKLSVRGTLTLGGLCIALGFSLLFLPIFSNQISDTTIMMVLLGSIASMATGALFIILHYYLRPQHTYSLHENGIRVFSEGKAQGNFVLFEKITDIYRCKPLPFLRYFTEGIAFRTPLDNSWNHILTNVENATRLIEILVQQQVQQRTERIAQALYQGGKLQFALLPSQSRWRYRMVGCKTRMQEAKELSLGALSLDSPQGQISIASISKLEVNLKRGEIALFNRYGEVILALDYYSLINADLFIALLEKMLNSKIPVHQSTAATHPSTSTSEVRWHRHNEGRPSLR